MITKEKELIIPPVEAADRFKKKFSIAPYSIIKATYADGNRIVLEKYEDKCLLCDKTEDMYEVDDLQICKHCIRSLYKLITEEEKE